jgi:hypothetical protein
MASERDGLSFCFDAHESMAWRIAGDKRIAETGSTPVAGRPLFFCTTAIDFMIIIVLQISKPSKWLDTCSALTT